MTTAIHVLYIATYSIYKNYILFLDKVVGKMPRSKALSDFFDH